MIVTNTTDSHYWRRYGSVLTLCYALVLMSGCRSTTGDLPSDAAAPLSETELNSLWTERTIGARVTDSPVKLGVSRNGLVVVTSEPYKLRAWFSDDNAYSAAESLSTSISNRLHIAAVGNVSGGLIAAANQYDTFIPELWFSVDGTSWAIHPTLISSTAADLGAIIAAGNRTIIGGARRVSGHQRGSPFIPTIWHSQDLLAWTQIELDPNGQSIVSKLVQTDRGIFALASGIGANLWQTVDEGSSWVNVAMPSPSPGWSELGISDITYGNGVLAAVGQTWKTNGETAIALFSSSDHGITWHRGNIPDSIALRLGHEYQASFAANAFWIVTERIHSPKGASGVDRCYVDIESCQQADEAVVLRSANGSQWSEIDLSSLNLPADIQLNAIVGQGAGIQLIIGAANDIHSWSWPTAASPAVKEAPKTLAPPALELTQTGDDLAIGTTYRFPLYAHCGMAYLAEFNGMQWYLADAPHGTFHAGAGQTPNPKWPVVSQTIFGFVTLIDADTIEYSIDNGDVIGRYHSSNAAPPGCD